MSGDKSPEQKFVYAVDDLEFLGEQIYGCVIIVSRGGILYEVSGVKEDVWAVRN